MFSIIMCETEYLKLLVLEESDLKGRINSSLLSMESDSKIIVIKIKLRASSFISKFSIGSNLTVYELIFFSGCSSKTNQNIPWREIDGRPHTTKIPNFAKYLHTSREAFLRRKFSALKISNIVKRYEGASSSENNSIEISSSPLRSYFEREEASRLNIFIKRTSTSRSQRDEMTIKDLEIPLAGFFRRCWPFCDDKVTPTTHKGPRSREQIQS